MKLKRILSLALCVCIAASTFPSGAVYALDPEPTPTDSAYAQALPESSPLPSESPAVQPETTEEPADVPADSDPTPTPSADTFSSEDSAPADAATPEDAPAVNGLPQEEKPLSEILGTDEDGSPKMYTTLYDDQNRVISTNDPTLEQDPFYLGGGTLDLGAAVYMRFRMAEILSQHEGGAQENVTYYMENLPQELVPAETDSEGNEILNPEEPVEFFQLGGNVTAHGGIYGSPEEGYRLKMYFEGLEEQIDISGAFQYGSNVSETLTPGATYWLTYVPGGSVSFTVTPTVPEPQEEGYTLNVYASSGGPTSFFWEAVIKKITPSEEEGTVEEDPNATFPYRELTITTPDAMGVWINEADGDIPGLLNAYGDKTGPGLRLGVVYTAKDAEDKKLTDSLAVDSSNCNLIRNDNGVTIIRMTGANGLQLDVEFRREDAVEGAATTYNGKNAYITNTAHVTISDGNGNAAKDIESLYFYIPTLTYDDYGKDNSTSYAYLTKATLSGAPEESGIPDIAASNTSNYSYGSLSTPTVSSGSQDPTNSYEYFPERVYTYLDSQSNTSSYRGNYYWVEFDPAIENHTNANYYISNQSFLPGNSLAVSGVNGQAASFTTDNANTFLAGMVGYLNDWQFLGEVSVAQVLGDPNLVANSCFSRTDSQYGSGAGDVKLQYQLKKVFANANGSGSLLIYRSARTHDYGEYAYLIIDPRTYDKAKENYRNNGWYEYVEGNGSAKPASWRIHVFNAPCTMLQASMYQCLGSLNTGDENTGGSATDQVKVGYGAYNSQAQNQSTTTYGFGRYQAAYMNAHWAGDQLIFWEMTINANNLPTWYNGAIYGKMDGSLYARPTGVRGLVEGQALDAQGYYIRDAAGKWYPLNTTYGSSGQRFDSPASIQDMNDNTTLTSNYGDSTFSIHFQNSSSLTSYAYPQGDVQLITIGFFTGVNGSPHSDSYSCTAELVMQNGDISRFVGSNGNTLPSYSRGSMQQYPIKIQATGYAPVPGLAKTGVAAVVNSNSDMQWTLTPQKVNVPYGSITSQNLFTGNYFGYGGYNGTLTISDSMTASSITDSNGNVIQGLNPGRYTHVTQMFTSGLGVSEYGNGSGSGPLYVGTVDGGSTDSSWQKYQNGNWVTSNGKKIWDPESPGIYRIILSDSSYTNVNNKQNPMAVYVFYAGNMADSVRNTLGSQLASGAEPIVANINDATYSKSLVVEYRGLNQALCGSGYIQPIVYTTKTDEQALLAAANNATAKSDSQKLAAYYDLSLKNSAGLSMWNVAGSSPSTTTVVKRISAELSIEKTAEPVNTGDKLGYTGNYTLKVTNGLTPTSKITVEDYLTGFSNVERKLNADGSPIPMATGTYTVEDTPAAMEYLMKHLDLKNISIQMKVDNSTTTIYTGGHFIGDGWQESSLAVYTDEGYSSGHSASLFKITLVNANIPAGAEFTIRYSTALNMDEPVDGETQTFRQSDYYLGGGLQISNSAEASRTYRPLNAAANSINLLMIPEGTVDGENNLLTVSCGGSVSTVYLMKDQLVKQKVASASDGSTSSWMFTAYTGTMGKENTSFALSDAYHYEIQAGDVVLTDPSTGSTFRASNISDPTERQKVLTLIEHLVEKHAVYRNIKLYYMDTQPTRASDLSESDLVWDLSALSIAGGTEVTAATLTRDGLTNLQLGATPPSVSQTWPGSAAAPGMGVTFTGTPAGLSLTHNEDGTDTLDHGHIGFTLNVQGAPLQKYLAATYDVDVDWDAVTEEVQRLLGNTRLNGKLVNVVSDDAGGQASQIGSTVRIEDATFTKSRVSSSPSNGTADWRINVNTGSQKKDRLVINDTINITLPEGTEDRVKTAAEAATYIDPATIVIRATAPGSSYFPTIYQNGAFTSYAASSGWTADNLTISAAGRNLSITIQNTDSNSILGADQTFRVEYSSRLDKNVFLQNGGNSNDAYTLMNAASLEYGSLNMSATAESSAKPNVPISASKRLESTYANTATWVASASTGVAQRKNFTLSDQVTSTVPAAEGAMLVDSMTIAVQNSVGNTVTYTPDHLPAGAALTAPDGSPFALGQTGLDGFVLSFDELPANTMVTVRYTTFLDAEKFLASGGQEGSVALHNAFHAGSADGAAADARKNGSVTIEKPFTKTGRQSDISTNGYPLVAWNLKVNLTEKYTTEQLAKMSKVTLTDVLSPVLRLYGDVTVTDQQGRTVEATIATEGQTLTVTIPNPAEHPNLTLEFQTECLASMDSLTNSADLSIDGTVVETTTSDEIQKVQVSGQHGVIQSTSRPVYTPTAVKYVNNELCTEAGKYQFQLTAVDENGEPLTGDAAYTETQSNGENGAITYTPIKYSGAGTYYYQIKELGKEALDTRVFTLQVDIVKTSNGYVVSQTVLSPENYAEVRFDNTVLPQVTDFTVTKVWKDNAASVRPESIRVALYQDGHPYDNMTVTLSEANNWTYTWTGLPVAGGEYSVVEEEVPYYVGSVTVDGTVATLTNTVVENVPTPTPSTTPSSTPTASSTPDKPQDSDKPKTPHPSSTPTTPTATAVPVAPQTGDTNNLALWFGMLLLCGGVLTVLAVRKKKSNK